MTLIQDELDKSQKYMLKTILNTDLVQLTQENVAIVEAMIKNDSDYYKSSDPEAGPTKKYIGSTAYWMKRLKKIHDSNKTNLQNLKIYVDSLDGNSSQLVTTFSAEYPGMYTIDIPGDIILSENQFKLKIQGFAGRYSVFTSNVDEDIEIIMDNGKIENSILYQSLLNNYQNIIILKGTSRNLNQNINYIVKNSNNVDVTNKFNISHNYSKGNYIYSLMRFNRDIELGEYTIYAYVNDELYDTFNVTIDYYMEVLEGSGTEDNPYLISNPVQLDMIRLDRYAAYKLKNDIDLTYDTQNENGLFYNNGLGWNPITYDDSILNFGNHKIYYSEGFGGILDGNNKKIIGLYINRPNEDVVGLFRNTRGDNWQKTAIIKNIILENVNITGKNYVGSLIGYAFGVSYGYASSLVVENISTNGIVKGNNHIGGIIGYYLDGLETSKSPNMLTDNRHRLINLYNSASVEATNYAGGIVGLIGPFHNYNNIILQVYNWQNTGNITSEGVTGGLIGQAISRNERILSINNSINTGKVTGTNVAGIVYDFESEPDNNSFQNGSLILNNIYYVNDIGYDNTNEAITANNVEKHTITELTNDNLYESFTNFSTYYNKETINSIKRIPFLKIANPTYTSVSNIELDNETPVNLFDYVTGSNDITFSINDSSIAEIDSNGIITPLKNGSTTINIISNYDGYTNNISLIVDKLVIGDVNGDWHIGPADHMALARYLDGSLELTETQLLASDVNQDGNVNEVDRIILLGYLANSEEYTTIPYLGDVSFNITYVMNGGTNYENAPTSYIYGTGVIINGTPTREGYTFEGWCTTEELTTCAKTQTISTEDYGDKTYYAKWIDSTITTGDIDFDGNIDLKDSMLLLKYLEGTVELSEEQLLAADVNLDGQVNEVDKVILLKHLANVEEYATLPYLGEVSFSITYVMNGGTNYENAPTSYVYGTGTVINIIPTKEDSTFGGWCNDEELTTCAKTQTISQSDMGDKTYYAKWAEIIIDPGHDNPPEETEYSINYVLNGGINNDNAPTSYIYGTGTVMNIIPTKEGSTFGGWCTDEELANCSMTIEITPIDTGDKTYYAKWIENTTEIVQGDMNSDGVISLQDIISLLRLYLEMDEVTDELILIGDMNNDGTIGLQDIISLLKIYLGVQ